MTAITVLGIIPPSMSGSPASPENKIRLSKGAKGDILAISVTVVRNGSVINEIQSEQQTSITTITKHGIYTPFLFKAVLSGATVSVTRHKRLPGKRRTKISRQQR